MTSIQEEVSLIGYSLLNMTFNNINEEMWILDSGASSHMTPNDNGMYNIRTDNIPITIGNGNEMKCLKLGDIDLIGLNTDGKEIRITLKNVKYIPKLKFNLISMNYAIEKGFEIKSNKNGILLIRENVQLSFDNKIMTNGASLLSMKVRQVYDYANINKQHNKLDVTILH